MDIESPAHLERFRDRPEIKAVLLRQRIDAGASEARFTRATKNDLYWPPIDELSATFLTTDRVREVLEPRDVYGRACWLIATSVVDVRGAPYAIAVAAADGATPDTLIELLRSVSHDYWNGSYFFK